MDFFKVGDKKYLINLLFVFVKFILELHHLGITFLVICLSALWYSTVLMLQCYDAKNFFQLGF